MTAGTSVMTSVAIMQLPALGVGLHEAVLDAVVHHLGEVAGTDLAGVHEARVAGRLEDVEERLDRGDVGLRRRRT